MTYFTERFRTEVLNNWKALDETHSRGNRPGGSTPGRITMHNESRGDRMIDCETVTVRVGSVPITVPAYTVPGNELRKRIAGIVETYLQRSAIAKCQTSLGDFALYVLTRAAEDPRSQSAPDDTEDTDGETPA